MTSAPSALAAAVVAEATARSVRIAVAESLTGGLLAAEIVGVPGASLAFSGGIVAYDTAVKHSLLGVDAGVLAERGPVDADVARQMARGVRIACALPGQMVPAAGAARADASVGVGAAPVIADLGVSTTGVAGPDPDPQTGQPAGTVWIGVSSPAGDRAIELQLAGSRAEIREATVEHALRAMLTVLRTAAFPQS